MSESLTIAIAVPSEPCEVDDDVLSRRVAAGDKRALEGLIERYEGMVKRLAFRLLGWSDGVEDVVQDVFLAAFVSIGKFRGESSLSTWLAAITVNRCRSHRRRRLLRLKFFANRELHESGQRETCPSDQSAIDGETAAQVRAAVDALPNKYREVIVLRYLEEMPIVEVARVLGLSRGAVDVRLTRARERLAKRLAGLMEK